MSKRIVDGRMAADAEIELFKWRVPGCDIGVSAELTRSGGETLYRMWADVEGAPVYLEPSAAMDFAAALQAAVTRLEAWQR